MKATIEQMEQSLRDMNFFVGGLTDEGIEFYYNQMQLPEDETDYETM